MKRGWYSPKTEKGLCDECCKIKKGDELGPDFGGSHFFCQECLDYFELAECHFELVAERHGIRLSQEVLSTLAYNKVTHERPVKL